MNYTNLVKKKKQYKYSANICFDMKDEEKLAGFIPKCDAPSISLKSLLTYTVRTEELRCEHIVLKKSI